MNQLFRFHYLTLLSLLIISCERNSENKEVDLQKFSLVEEEGLTIPLDSVSPPKAPFVQLLENEKLLTFYNAYNRAIYWFDIEEKRYINKTTFDSEGENQVIRPAGYHILNKDSIFVFDMARNEMVLLNDKSEKLSANSLINNRAMNNPQWTLEYPQFFPRTVTPFIQVDDKLLFSGSYMWAIPDSIIESFKFTAAYNFKNEHVSYNHSYPNSLYGSKFNWNDPLYTMVYYDWNPNEKTIVYSFPISNSLFSANLGSRNLDEKVDSKMGSRILKPISDKRPARELMLNHLLESDLYVGIKYDKYRNVYYRVLMNAISDTGEFKDLSGKPISIVIYDSEFNVIGNKKIGLYKNWNLDNLIVSKDGLLIEYIDLNSSNEDFMIFKNFKLVENEN